jgi:hypothetical protein
MTTENRGTAAKALRQERRQWGREIAAINCILEA